MNKTQCPHCFTVYVISEEQLSLSQGMVRCGTCRERFKASILTAGGAPEFRAEETFIEPLTDDVKPKVSADDFIERASKIAFSEPGSPINEDNQDTETESLATGLTSAFYEFDDSLNSELSIAMVEDLETQVDPQEMDKMERAIQQQLELSKPNEQPQRKGRASKSNHRSILGQQEPVRDEQLINEVDALIEDKLLSGAAKPQVAENLKTPEQTSDPKPRPSATSETDLGDSANDLFAKPRKHTSKVTHVLAAGALLLLTLGLIAGLLYQLWLKQSLPWAAQIPVEETLAPLRKTVGAIPHRNTRAKKFESA